MAMMTFQTRLKNSRKPTLTRIRFDLEKLNDPTVMSAFQTTIGGRFASLATLVDEDVDLDSMVTHFDKAVTDTAAELLGKQRRKRKPWVTPEILDLCGQRRALKKKRGKPEGAKDNIEIKRKIMTVMKMAKEWGLGRAMMLGSFQCRGVLLLWHMVEQGPAVLAAGAGWVGCFFLFFSSRLSYLPFQMPHLLGDGWTY